VEGPAERTFWAHLNRPFAVGFALTAGGLVALALGFAVRDLITVWIYIAFALFTALGLDPVVRRLQRRGMPRAWAIALVSLGLAVILVGFLWLVVPTLVRQVGQFFSDIPRTIAAFTESDVYGWIHDQFGGQVPTLLTEVQSFLTNPANIAAIGGGVLEFGVTVASTVSGLLIVIVLTLYFLASLPQIKGAVYRLSPARSRATVADLTEQITDSVGGYLGGMVVLAFCNSIVAFVLHLSLSLPFPVLMAVGAFFLTIIPLVGTVLYWVIASSLALFTSPTAALIFAAVYLGYMQLEAYLLTPRVMNRTISVPGSLVVIGALVGGTLAGLLGALVAIPVTASILLIVKKVIVPRQDAKL